MTITLAIALVAAFLLTLLQLVRIVNALVAINNNIVTLNDNLVAMATKKAQERDTE